jgi:hypothetical protein
MLNVLNQRDVMGTIIGLILLALIAYTVKKTTGLHLHRWIEKKYQEYEDSKK